MSKIEELKKIVDEIIKRHRNAWKPYMLHPNLPYPEISDLIDLLLDWHNKHQRELDREKIIEILRKQTPFKQGKQPYYAVYYTTIYGIAQALCEGDVYKDKEGK